MNSFKKIGQDFLVASDDVLAAGTAVTVHLRDGRTKQVTVGALAFPTKQYGQWLYKQVRDREARPAPVDVGSLSAIMAIFQRAAQHLKFPAIVLMLDTARRPGETDDAYKARVCHPDNLIRINVATERAREPGSLTVLAEARDEANEGRRPWLGRILLDGTYTPSREAPANLGARLAEFAKRPAEIAAECGRLNGRCCFCNQRLRDERSTAVGYGETCADHWGMPWGGERFTFDAPSARGSDADYAESIDREMAALEAEADREETIRDERNKHRARRHLEQMHRGRREAY